MPIVGIRKDVLDKRLDKCYNETEFDELCFDYGLELDEVTSEKAQVQKEQGDTSGQGLSEDVVYKVELPANRYDLLCAEGLTTALMVFLKKRDIPDYKLTAPKKYERLVVKEPTQSVRPFVVAAILRDVVIDQDAYNSFIDLQDKLHQNLCRKRSLVAIGTHDLDTIQGPFVYTAQSPGDIRFKALNQEKELNANELMELYQNDTHLKHYLPIIRDKPLYPVIYNNKGVVLSMPPIINGEHSKITLKTKNIFIEATATDLTKATIVLDTLVTAFSHYAAQTYTVEPVEVEQVDGTVTKYPLLPYREETVNVKNINSQIGVSLSPEEMADLLTRMCLKSVVIDNGAHLRVTVPPTRHDIIHECDIVEDVGIAYGYNKIVPKFPHSATVAEGFPINKLTDALRHEMAQAGFTEALTFSLCSRDEISTKLRKPDDIGLAVQISNPKTLEFQVCRTALTSGLLKTISYNKDVPLPLRIFEIQDVILKDKDADTGARNERRLCAVYYGKTSGFELIHGLLDRVMAVLGIANTLEDSSRTCGYAIRPGNDPSYFTGRCAEVLLTEGEGQTTLLGRFGVLHPEVLTAFDLTLPASALEITIEPFV